MPAIELTMPSGAPAAASVGPCSMCSSTKHAGAGSSQPARGSSPSPSDANASAREMPSASRRSPSSSSSCPQTARLPNTPRPKRGPSSRRKAMTTRPRRGAPSAPIASAASSALSTPRAPSKRPPSGGVSRCEPLQTSGRSGSLPGSLPTRLPAGSRVTSRPASRIQPATSSWARSSPAPEPGPVGACRHTDLEERVEAVENAPGAPLGGDRARRARGVAAEPAHAAEYAARQVSAALDNRTII